MGTAVPNQGSGVTILEATSNTLAGNVIAGNNGDGVFVACDSCTPTTDNVLEANRIGFDGVGTGETPLANADHGVEIRGGDAAIVRGNDIAFNARAGVAVRFFARSNPITGNRIRDNGGLGIDLGGGGNDGVTDNDSGDGDDGANRLQNFPVITSAVSNGTSTTVTGTLNSTPGTSFEIELFALSASEACDDSGHGEGPTPVTPRLTVTTDAAGNAQFTGTAGNAEGFVTATATNLATSDTSEFSACAQVTTPATVQFSAATYQVAENAGPATITVTRSGDTEQAVGVDYATSSGSATAGSDYTTASGTSSFAAGQTTATFDVPVTDDAADEPNETVNLALDNPHGGAALGSPSAAVLTIVDNDEATNVQFSASSYQVAENAGPATITVNRSGSTQGAVSVDYATTNGSATAGSDYTATSGTLSFAAGQTSATFDVPVTDDATDEANETVNLTLSNPGGGATLGSPSTAVLTIVDNELDTVQFSAATYSVSENGGTSTITVTRSGGGLGPATVNYATTNGSATAGSDYTTASGTLIFAPAQISATFTVPVTDDASDEPDETVNLALANPLLGATLGSPSTAVLTIVDDDPGPIDLVTTTTTTTTTPAVTTTGPRRPSGPLVRGGATTRPTATTVPTPTTGGPPVTAETVTPPSPPPPPPPPPPVEESDRSEFVESVRDPTEISFSLRLLGENSLLAILLVLLVAFPAEMFNATLLEHYDEISGWFRASWIESLRGWLARLPTAAILASFAGAGALLYGQLSPDFGFNRASLALLLGMFACLLVVSLVYDVARAGYLRARFGVPSRLRAQVIGLLVGAILVFFSRAANFLPGYLYGLFTALAFQSSINRDDDGRGLAWASVWLGAAGLLAWFAWIPVEEEASEEGANLAVLAVDAMLPSLWVAALGAIVFGLVPLRFFYGEVVRAWSSWRWLLIYVVGTFFFVHVLLHPDRGFYGNSEDVSVFSVLALFIAFAAFSLAFWGYFRLRPLWRGSPPTSAPPPPPPPPPPPLRRDGQEVPYGRPWAATSGGGR